MYRVYHVGCKKKKSASTLGDSGSQSEDGCHSFHENIRTLNHLLEMVVVMNLVDLQRGRNVCPACSHSTSLLPRTFPWLAHVRQDPHSRRLFQYYYTIHNSSSSFSSSSSSFSSSGGTQNQRNRIIVSSKGENNGDWDDSWKNFQNTTNRQQQQQQSPPRFDRRRKVSSPLDAIRKEESRVLGAWSSTRFTQVGLASVVLLLLLVVVAAGDAPSDSRCTLPWCS